jgi:hypothetical protein
MRWGWILLLSGTFLIADVAHAQTPAPAPAKTPAQAPAKEPSNKPGLALPIVDTAKPWTGDLDGMIKRRAIRVLVPYSRTYYFEHYAKEPMDPLNKGLFAFAAYNAGPGRIRQLRRLSAERGLDPNVWFNNVELLAAEKIGRETVTYVSNIYKYYLAYQMVEEERAERAKAKSGEAAR